jgi:hypothetical protein
LISIFDQPHIFIVFSPGSGGNFISGIVNEISSSTLRSLEIAASGSSHTVLGDKSEGTDYLSFGTLMEEHDSFLTEEARESFYIDNINQKYSTFSRPEIVWTHDYTNIPLYRKYFKNARILVITNDTLNEKLLSIFMLSKKTILCKDVKLPVTQGLWEYIWKGWQIYCFQQLSPTVGEEHAKKMLRDRFNPDYLNILHYYTVRMFLTFHNMLHLVEDIPEQEILFDLVFYPMRLRYGNKLNSYIDEDCVVLPYSYLSNNDCDQLIDKISALLNQELTNDEIEYIKISFEKYRSSQGELLLSDPVGFYNQLKHSVINSLS